MQKSRTVGYIELRKYVDVAGRDGTDDLYLVNGEQCEYIDASDGKLSYFEDLISDIQNRTETAMPTLTLTLSENLSY